jgi:hypothetical protein
MPRYKGLQRFKTWREAELVLREIVEDGGVASEYRIEALPDGGFVIVVLDGSGDGVAGMLGA